VVVVVVVVVSTPHTDANSIQKDNHQLNSKRQKGAPLSLSAEALVHFFYSKSIRVDIFCRK
jgi:hypothetical protein